MDISPTLLVIVGITGDLAKRKLLPALVEIAKAGVLPDKFKIIGITRQSEVDISTLFNQETDQTYLRERLTIFQMDLGLSEDYSRLKELLANSGKEFGLETQNLFYLSVPPQVSPEIVEHLGQSGLAEIKNTKILLEKPFGIDLSSATFLIEQINKYFKPEQVYRIDHYLAKEMAQNLIIFRESNSLFRRTWNADFIERIEIVASEQIGIEGRANFYEQTGALRDLIQSHLLQLAAITLMDLSESSTVDIPLRRLAALKSLRVKLEEVKRGQYLGYREEVKNPNSVVETFVSLTLFSDNSRWSGVPIKLVTGKFLDQKTTEIRIFYRQDQMTEANELILRLQPDEGVLVRLWAKRPGYDKQIERHLLHFSYAEHYDKLPEAYEQVLLDSMVSDHSLFTSSEEVLESWRIVDLVQADWKNKSSDLIFYEPGSKPDKIV